MSTRRMMADQVPSFKKTLFRVLLVAIAIRLVSVPLIHRLQYTGDEREYLHIGRTVAYEGKFVDSNGERSARSPLYPLILAVIFRLAGDSLVLPFLLNCLLGAFAVWLSASLSVRLGNDHRVAAIVGIAAALCPGLVIYSALLQTESLFIVFFLLALIFSYRVLDSPGVVNVVVLGIVSGLAALTRAVFLGYFPFLLVSLAWLRRKQGQRNLLPIVYAAAVFVLVLTPWAVRDYMVHHRVLVGTSVAGRLFLIGNNPYATGTWSVERGFDRWFHQQALERGIAQPDSLDELRLRSLYTDVALGYICAHPLAALKGAIRKAHIFFIYPITHTDSYLPLQALAVVFDFALLAGAVIGLVSSFGLRARLLPVYLAGLYFPAVQILLEAEARYRLPLMPLWCLFFGWGVGEMVDRERRSAVLSRREARMCIGMMMALIVLVYVYTAWLFFRGRI